jgi:hypothetical protein
MAALVQVAVGAGIGGGQVSGDVSMTWQLYQKQPQQQQASPPATLCQMRCQPSVNLWLRRKLLGHVQCACGYSVRL